MVWQFSRARTFSSHLQHRFFSGQKLAKEVKDRTWIAKIACLFFFPWPSFAPFFSSFLLAYGRIARSTSGGQNRVVLLDHMIILSAGDKIKVNDSKLPSGGFLELQLSTTEKCQVDMCCKVPEILQEVCSDFIFCDNGWYEFCPFGCNYI